MNLILLCTFAFFLSTYFAQSQEFVDSRGKDFWISFIPNSHTDGSYINNTIAYDSLYILISADKKANGKIEYRNRLGQKFTNQFRTYQDSSIYRFAISCKDNELLGFNESTSIEVSGNDNEKVSPLYFHVSSDVNVAVFCMQKGSQTNDGFLALPIHSLGLEYFVMSYNSDGELKNNFLTNKSTPSQFAILATEDNTIIDISPSCETFKNKKNIQKIKLMKGESYLVQADISTTILNNDLTGTKVRANKKIALFSGHNRATIPILDGYINASRDILVEQLPPTSAWGRNAIVIPFFKFENETLVGKDLFRVLAAYDSTSIFFNGVFQKTLNSGEFVESEINEAVFIESNNPILCASFKKSSRRESGSTNSTIGDPFMMINPPIEQYSKAFSTYNFQTYSPGFVEDMTMQNITTIVPNADVNKVYIDNILMPTTSYNKIGNSDYSYITYVEFAGPRYIHSDAEIMVYVMGYGRLYSYGYSAGMQAKHFDFNPPNYSIVSEKCKFVDFDIRDTLIYDSGIKSIYLEKYSNNVSLENTEINSDIDSLKVRLNLINPFKDASATFSIRDSFGLDRKVNYQFNSLTVAKTSDYSDTNNIAIFEDSIKVGELKQYTIEFENYGITNQNCNVLNNKINNLELIQQIQTLNLQPSQKSSLNFSYSSDSSQFFVDTIFVSNNCFKRAVAIVKLYIIKDTFLPTFKENSSLCNQENNLLIYEMNRFDSGINTIEIVDSSNISILNIENMHDSAKVYYKVNDQFLDAKIQVKCKDKTNNILTFERSISSIDLQIAYSNNGDFFDIGKVSLNSQICDSLKIFNFSNQDYSFNNAKLLNNTIFSIPNTQFPFVLKAKDSLSLFVCVYSQNYNKIEDKDTLLLISDCFSRQINLRTKIEELKSSTETRCGLDINFRAKTSINTTNMFYSNSNNQSKLLLETENEIENARLMIYSSNGALVYSSENMFLEAGEYSFDLKNLDLSNSIYFAVFETKNLILKEKFLYNK